VWVQSSGGSWYVGKLVAVNGTASYATSVPLAGVPLAVGYRIRVGYRAVSGSGSWTLFGLSGGSFAVNPGISLPTISGTYSHSGSLPVTWTTSSAVSAGQFAVWLQSSGGSWYVGKLVAVNGSASYATSVPLAGVPLASGYRVRVGYRAVSGSGSWTVFGLSGGSFTVN
jgi:hypothetical protein